MKEHHSLKIPITLILSSLCYCIFVLTSSFYTSCTDCSGLNTNCTNTSHSVHLSLSSGQFKDGTYRLNVSKDSCQYTCTFGMEILEGQAKPTSCIHKTNSTSNGCDGLFYSVSVDTASLVSVHLPINSLETTYALELLFQGKTILSLPSIRVQATISEPRGPGCQPICYHGGNENITFSF